MSYYYNYCVGYLKDGKIYPLGPYTCDGKLKDVISKSRSFASDLHERFYPVKEEQISDELRKAFEYEDWNGQKRVDVKYLPKEELPTGSFIKQGYFLIDEVKQYEEDGDEENFSTPISSQIYTALLEKELKFGPNKPKKDCEGYEYTDPNASDYMFYMYPDYQSEEYEAALLREAVDSLESYDLTQVAEIVILETEG